ncbi:MAG TPA: hypothetical protein VN519_11485 [Bryobacteraceae bacterium]|nr:hypothetical protein [Bryobacteraceae bacterium]
MANRSIEEAFEAIKPRGRRGVAESPVLETGVGDTADLSAALSQAGEQIAQLQAAYQQQVTALAANTQALQRNSGGGGSQSAGTKVEHAVGSLESGLGLLGPLISGIAGLFGGGNSQPAPLPVYVPPPPVSIDAVLRADSQAPLAGGQASVASAASSTPPAAANITVNVSAMDSQSLMDRSYDIASAVREAMLNLHPINDVVASL